ncbi:MAG: hypothetical protein KDB82_01880 [Planctomycetes bacterium]|nr:hypothetical protein [Planctomycetota bacterium]
MSRTAAGLLLLLLVAGTCQADPAVSPNLNPDHPPDRPARAFEREELWFTEYKPTTFGKLMQEEVKAWRTKLDPPVAEGNPAEMHDVKTDGFWWDGISTLKAETRNGKYHGYAEATYNNSKTVYAKGNFRDGEMHGTWLFYDEKGELEYVRCYAKGKQDGPCAAFAANESTELGQFAAGERKGEWVTWSGGRPRFIRQYDESGKLAREREYDSERKLVTLREFVDGVPAPEVTAWRMGDGDKPVQTPDPKRRSSRLELLNYGPDGKLQGWQTLYQLYTGVRQFDVFYTDGKQTGPFIEYGKYGVKTARQGQRRDGVDVGKWITVDEQGKTREFTRDDEGLFHGRYTTKNADGRLITDATFEHGKATEIKMACQTADEIDQEYYDELPDRKAYWVGRGDADEVPRFKGLWRFTREDETLAAEGEYKEGRMTGLWKFYYPNGVSLRFEAEFIMGRMNGACTKYDESGNKVEAGAFEHGGRQGAWTGWHPNGQVAWTGTYRRWQGDTNESKSGHWVLYHEDGTLSERGDYDDFGTKLGKWEYFDEEGWLREVRNERSGAGDTIIRETRPKDPPEGVQMNPEQMNGTWIWIDGRSTLRRAYVVNDGFMGKYSEYYPDGSLKMQGELHGQIREGAWTIYSTTGKPLEVAVFKGGEKHGEYKAWRADGTLMRTGQYTNDKLTGTWREYHPDGSTVATELSYGPSGEYEGRYRAWAANGQLVMDGYYSASRKQGLWQEWWANGKQKSSGKFKDGLPAGVWKTWTEEGEPASETDYDAEEK